MLLLQSTDKLGFMENHIELINLITINGEFTFVKGFAVGDQKVCTKSLFS